MIWCHRSEVFYQFEVFNQLLIKMIYNQSNLLSALSAYFLVVVNLYLLFLR
ncbi:unnamed protein product [Meloidogyne enterolobii]|uniref:Uncharacterized protein n=1 Tax=Meloidogyne enterolobii TaxID=390850 RepID=A0ACB0ZNB1_MELEN